MSHFFAALNPYWGKHFFEVFQIFIYRMAAWIKGDIHFGDLVSDEIQMLVLAAVACASALVGTFLVLKRMTMLANSLSHTILLGIVLAYLILFPFTSPGNQEDHALSLGVLLTASLLTGLVTVFLTQFLSSVMKLQEDASTGLVFSTLFALGVVLVTVYTKNMHVGTEAIMGNADALHGDDLKLIFFVGLIDVFAIVLFFKEFKLSTFDPLLARTLGFSNHFFNYLLMVLTAATAIGAFRAVGVLLFLAFLVGPVLSARLLCNRLSSMILCAILIGCVCAFSGVALSRDLLSRYHIPLSTGGLVVCLIALVYILILAFAPKRGLFIRMLKRKFELKNQTR